MDDQGRMMLKKCSLIVSTSSDPESELAEEQSTVAKFVSAIAPKYTFVSLQELTLSLTPYWYIPEAVVPSILNHCSNLRALHISHGVCNVSVDRVLHSLPFSVKNLVYNLVVPHNEISSFDTLLANCISSSAFNARRYTNLAMKFLLIEEFFISSPANDGALIIPGQLTTLDFALNQPPPTLHLVPEACARADIKLKLGWGRSVKTHEWISADTIGTGNCHWYMLDRRNTYVYEITAPVVH
jgi:hypothetical protein